MIAAVPRETEALDIELRSIDTLTVYERNARLHSDAQIEQVVRSILEFGWTNPALIDADGGIIAGHARFAAAQRIYQRGQRIKSPNGATLPDRCIPVIDCHEWSDAQKRAYILADNQLALNAEWDTALLAGELKELKLEGFDLALTGFDIGELDELLADDASALHDELPKIPEAEEKLNAAWRLWRTDCTAALALLEPLRVVSVGYSRNFAKIHFLNALYYRRHFPNFATLAYQPHRLRVAGDSYSLLDLLRGGDQFKDERLRFALVEVPSWERLLRTGLPFAGCRMPLDFPVRLAQSLIDEFCAAGGHVLDPCHGWGGRVIGFLLSHADYYMGFDPSPETAAGVRGIVEDFGPYVPAKTATLHAECFEDAELPADAFDFALTSPPYYDTETYTGAEQSHARYRSFDEWNREFYSVMIERVYAALKRSRTFALVVGNQRYPLEREAVAHAQRVGFEHVETRSAGMDNNLAQTQEGEGEVIVILRKP